MNIKIGSSEFSGRFLRGSGAIFYVSNRWQKGDGIVGPDFQLERSMTKWRRGDLKVTVTLSSSWAESSLNLGLARAVGRGPPRGSRCHPATPDAGTASARGGAGVQALA